MEKAKWVEWIRKDVLPRFWEQYERDPGSERELREFINEMLAAEKPPGGERFVRPEHDDISLQEILGSSLKSEYEP